VSASHRFRLLLVGCIVVAATCVATVSPAGASFGIDSFEAFYSEAPFGGGEAEVLGPPDLQAGSHPDQFTANIAFNTKTNAKGEKVADGFAKNVEIKLPRGVVGNLNGIPQCSQSTFMSFGLFGGATCPVDTQVGVMTLNGEKHALFNLVPPAGAAGQLGAVVLIAPVVMDLSIRSDDYGLTAEIHDLSQAQEAREVSVALWGVPADPRHNHLRCLERKESEESPKSCPSGAPLEPMLTMPTSCAEPLTTGIAAQSWENPDASSEKSVTTTDTSGASTGLSGCERLHFDPRVTVASESAAADTPTGLSIDVHVPYQGGATELAEASLENLVVGLPAGMSINPATAGGLIGCTAAQIALGQASKPACPDTSKIGALEIQTPILPKALRGFVYLAQPPPGLFEGKVAIYLAGEEAGFDFKLAGQLDAQPDTGQLTLTLEGVPELPLADLSLNLLGGPRGAIANPAVCAPLTTNSLLTPYATAEATTRSSGLAVDEGCDGGFAPSFMAGATSSAAGHGTGFALKVSRNDGQQYIQKLTAALPPGLMANVSSVPQCGEADAAAGACPATSEIGTVSVAAGAGPDPFYLNGRVYLTGPHGGAPFGIAMVIPALAGPFDLGTVLVRGGIAVDLAHSSLTIATDSFPAILQGIPLRLKSVDLAIDRSGFMINPTSCAGEATSSTVGSVAGFAAPLSAPFRVVGCAGLPFSPKVKAATLGKASRRGNGGSLNVKVTDTVGIHANLRSVTVKLPKALKPRLSAIQQACLATTFATNVAACPAASVVGRAAVDTPMLGVPLVGPVYLVFRRGSAKFPDLMLVLRGGGLELQLKGAIEISKGVSSTTFGPLPDIPLSLFELDLPEGSHSLLGATANLCAKAQNMSNALVGQNGTRSEGSARTAVEGCHARAARVGGHRKRVNASRARSIAHVRKRGRR
jgi:hypothetical protein